jgi:hypothetical protein
MIDFKTYSKVIKLIANELTKNSLGFQRRSLPQIVDVKDFKKFLNKQKISYNPSIVKSHNLKPVQKHLNPEKIIKLLKGEKLKQIIVSSDNYIIDGHHTWACAVIRNENIECLVVHKPAKQLLEIILDEYENIILQPL